MYLSTMVLLMLLKPANSLTFNCLLYEVFDFKIGL